MNNIFDNLLRIMVGICTLLFVFTAGVALLLFNAERRLFNPDLYLRALERQNIYDHLPTLAAEIFAAYPSSDDPDSPRATLNLLPTENWGDFFEALLPAEVSQPMTEQALRSVFEYLNGESGSASLSMVEFKAHLTSLAGTEALVHLLRAQPDCTLEQIAQVTIESLMGKAGTFFLCNPSDEILTLFQPILQGQLQTMAAVIPDSVDLTPSKTSTENPLQGLRAVRGIMRFSPVVPLGLLFLVTVFAIRDLKSWLHWWGVPLLFGGLFGLILTAAINPLTKWAFSTYAEPRLPALLPLSVTETIRGLISSVLTGLAMPIVFQAFVLMLIGFLMLVATRIRKQVTSQSEAND